MNVLDSQESIQLYISHLYVNTLVVNLPFILKKDISVDTVQIF